MTMARKGHVRRMSSYAGAERASERRQGVTTPRAIAVGQRSGCAAVAPWVAGEACGHRRAVSSAHVDVDDLDGVVPVAEPVPGRDPRLYVPGRVGRPGAERVPTHLGGVPVERPVLPLVGTGG